jgi:hypothetical protein
MSSDIKEAIAKLLEKRRTLLELQDHQRVHGEVTSNVHGDLEIAKECKRKIEELWDSTRDAANHVKLALFSSGFLLPLIM